LINIKSPALIHALCLPLWFVAFIANNVLLTDAAALWATVILVYWFWNRLGNSIEMIRFLRMGSVVLGLVQNIGWIIASLIHHFFLKRSIEYSLAHLMKGGLDVSYYALSILYITLFCFVLSLIGSHRFFYFLEIKVCEKLYSLKQKPPERLSKFLLCFIFLSIFLIFSGVMGFRSVTVKGLTEGEVPAWLVLYKSILPAQILLTALLLFRIITGKDKRNLVIWLAFSLSLFVLLLVSFTEGRRALFFALIGLLYWYIFFSGKKPRLYLFILLFAVIYPVFSQGILFFNFLRGENGVSDWQTESVVEIIPRAWERFQSSADLLETEKQNTLENLATRPLEATPLALSMQLSSYQKTFTTGENFLNSLIWTIPGPLFPSKKNYPVQEHLLYKHFAIGRDKEEDTVDSIYLTAYTEFSWAGILFYALLAAALWLAVLYLVRAWNADGLILAIIIMIFFKLLFAGIGESSFVEWLTTVRSFLFWIIIHKAIRIFSNRRVVARRIYPA